MDPLIRWLRVMGAQLIVWHHFALYGPMSDVAYPLAEGLFDWLIQYGRLAVQVFLVMGGFLAARLLERPLAEGFFTSLCGRYLRLARPYWVALLLALLSAWVARALIVHLAVPSPASPWQVVANALMLQDIVGVEALSAGVWYVAIDMQLYALMLVITKVCPPRSAAAGEPLRAARGLVLVLTLLSLLWVGRHPDYDIWAPYFFGSYGLGVIACWARQERARRWAWRALIVAFSALTLALQWRSRAVLAGCLAMLLSFDFTSLEGAAPRWLESAVRRAADSSYELFLLHYPVCLGVGAVVFRRFPHSVAANVAGLLLAWSLSMAAAHALNLRLNAPPRRNPSSAAATARSAGTA